MPGVFESLRNGWNRFFFTGYSVESLGALRVFFGAGLFVFHFTQFDMVFRYHLGGPSYYYLDPMWHFQLLGISHDVAWLTIGVFAVLLISTVTFTVGFWTRTSIVVLMLSILYLKGVRDSVAGDVHHRYLIPFQILFLLALSKCGWAYSLDQRIRAGAGAVRERVAEWQASWPIKAAQLYIVSFYFWAGIAKLRVSGMVWFEGGERIQHLLMKRALLWGTDEAGVPLGNSMAYEMAQMPWLCFVLGVSTLVFELGFPLLLLVKSEKWRLLLLTGVVGFHLANTVLAYVGFLLIPIVFFTFFDMDPWYRRLRDRFRRSGPSQASVPG